MCSIVNNVISIKDKKDFLLIKKIGKKFVCDSFVCLYSNMHINCSVKDRTSNKKKIFLGLIATRKIACAVKRNKLRRRIKAIFSMVNAKNDSSFIMIARFKIFTCNFRSLSSKIQKCVSFFEDKKIS